VRGEIVPGFLGEARRALPVNVVLVGYRGTGKTSVGRILAAKLRKPFLDSDEMVKISAGKCVLEMVMERGWDFFRKEEKRIVAELSRRDECIVALGGGAVLDEENVRNLKDKGLFIWLTAEGQTIARRLNGDGKTREQRPPLTGKDPGEEIRSLLKIRGPVYEKIADCRIDTSNRSIEEVAVEVLRFLGERAQAGPGEGKRDGR
jgi:shikimate kinase